MKLTRILILEDDLETLSRILEKLNQLEKAHSKEKTRIEFSPVVIAESPLVDTLINNNESLDFDIILLDRDCKLCGSFHTLNIEKFGVGKVIAISSVPNYNDELKERGVSRVVHKDYQKLDEFTDKLGIELENLLNSNL